MYEYLYTSDEALLLEENEVFTEHFKPDDFSKVKEG